MVLPSSPRVLLASLLAAAAVDAQWIYPPPLPNDASLSAYVAGTLKPNSSLTFAAADILYGGFHPGQIPLYLIYRCAHSPPQSKADAPTIGPSNASFTSTAGVVTSDGTWQAMPFFTASAFSNAFSPGQNIVYHLVVPDANATTGNMCWLELSAGSETNNPTSPFEKNVTLHGGQGEHWYTEPWIVLPKREDAIAWPYDKYANGTDVETAASGTGSGTATATATGKVGDAEKNPGSRAVLGKDILWAVVLGGAVVFAVMI